MNRTIYLSVSLSTTKEHPYKVKKNSKIDFFINYEKTALQIFFYFVRMFFGS